MPASDLPPIHQLLAESYDDVPYDSAPFPASQPTRLAANAVLFGLSAPPVETARVLELGCSAGGNIIPLAAHYPKAQFTGIDISGVQIADGQARVAQLGLTNIRLIQGSFVDWTAAEGVFDYIISHGVYSWVPEDIREALMRVSSTNLAPGGIAYMSYNIYPGWHLKNVARDMMLYHSNGRGSARARVQAGREVLSLAATTAAGAYPETVAHEAELLKGYGDYYIRHEHLSEHNYPVYFRDFAAHAGRYGLSYLGESNLPITLPEAYLSKTSMRVRYAAAGDFIRMQQYLDFFIGRTFRASMFVKDAQAAHIDRRITSDRFENIWITPASPLRREAPTITTDQPTFASNFVEYRNNEDGILVSTLLQLRAMEVLRNFNLGSLRLAEIAEKAAGTQTPAPEQRREVAELLLELFRRRMLNVSATPQRWAAVSERPRVFPLVAADAAGGRAMTATVTHNPVGISFDATRRLLQLADGTRDHAALEREMYDLVEAGAFKLENHNRDYSTIADKHVAVKTYVDATIRNYANLQLLCE